MSVDLVSVGEAFEDLIFHGLARLPRPGEELRTGTFTRTMGGGTLITALAAARLGVKVEVISALPDDAVKRLKAEGARVRNLRDPGEPHAVSVALSTRHERAFATFAGVNESLDARVLACFEHRLPTARHVHFALGPRNLTGWVRLLDRLRARGITTSWDFGWHDALGSRRGFAALVGALDWVFLNEREARLYAGAPTLATAMSRWPGLARRVVVKQGARGACALMDGARVRVAAPRTRVVDTTGAGDAFNGGFLAGLVQRRDVTHCLRLGVLVGSLSTRAAGGIDALPSRAEVADEARAQKPPRGRREAADR